MRRDPSHGRLSLYFRIGKGTPGEGGRRIRAGREAAELSERDHPDTKGIVHCGSQGK